MGLLETVMGDKKIIATLNRVDQYLKEAKAVGTSPGEFGWPALTVDMISRIQKRRPDLIILAHLLNAESKNPILVVYGKEPQQCWTLYAQAAQEFMLLLEGEARAKAIKSVNTVKVAMEEAYKTTLHGTVL